MALGMTGICWLDRTTGPGRWGVDRAMAFLPLCVCATSHLTFDSVSLVMEALRFAVGFHAGGVKEGEPTSIPRMSWLQGRFCC